MLLMDAEVLSCLGGPFCDIKSPSSQASAAPTCISALFFQQHGSIDKMCRKSILPTSQVSILRYLDGGKWLVSTGQDFTLKIICEGPRKGREEATEHLVKSGTQVVELDRGCRGSCDYLDP